MLSVAVKKHNKALTPLRITVTGSLELRGTAMRLLVAGIQGEDLEALEEVGRKLGYETTVCDNGVRAWRLIDSGICDVVIVAENMEGFGGLEICRRVQEQYDRARRPLMIVSADKYSQLSDYDARLAGADELMRAPKKEEKKKEKK